MLCDPIIVDNRNVSYIDKYIKRVEKNNNEYQKLKDAYLNDFRDILSLEKCQYMENLLKSIEEYSSTLSKFYTNTDYYNTLDCVNLEKKYRLDDTSLLSNPVSELEIIGNVDCTLTHTIHNIMEKFNMKKLDNLSYISEYMNFKYELFINVINKI